MQRKLFAILFILFAFLSLKGQDTIAFDDDYALQAVITGHDTAYISQIDELIIFPEQTFTNLRSQRRYDKLMRNVLKVYPFVKLAGEKYHSLEAHLLTLKTEKEKKNYVKKIEQEIMDNFKDDLEGLTITQGRILIKLIDREIGETSYVLLQQFRGNISAFFWQSLARLFGHNLKSEYDAEGEDKNIEEIMKLIESGKL